MKISTTKERILQLIEYKRISKSLFFEKTEIKRGFLDSDKLNQAVSDDHITKIVTNFPEINIEWLITGNGPMLKIDNPDHLCVELSQNCTSGTPIYDKDVTCGNEIRDFRDEDIIGYINIPSIRKDSKIVFATGDSMFPKITDGDRIAIREIESWDYFNYGQMYLILTPEYRMLKYIRKHPISKDLIILKSENSNYDDIELKMSEIVKLFIVENILSIKSL